MFADYSIGRLDAKEVSAFLDHVIGCAMCSEDLRELRPGSVTTSDAELQDLIARANRELAAYDLAKQLAEWLATEAYPREETAVRSSFESTYQAMMEQDARAESEASTKTPELVGLGFTGKPSRSMAQKIVALSALAGQLREAQAESAGAVADALENRSSALKEAGLSSQLIHKAIKHLRA